MKILRVFLNIGGERFEALWSHLARHPTTRLGQLETARNHEEILNCCHSYSLADNEYFFDINSRSFRSILNFYATGELHMMDEVCVMAFGEDLQYWGIDELRLPGAICLFIIFCTICLGSLEGPVIQATGKMGFQDG